MTSKARILYTLAGWFTAAFIYIFCGAMNGKEWVIQETLIDKVIPFDASGIWLYLAFYIFIPYAFFTVDMRGLKTLSIAFIVTSILSGVVFICLPSTIVYPQINADSVSSRLLAFVSRNDTERNCFPSLHASLIALCMFSLISHASALRRFAVIVLALAMFYSIIQVRRHVFIDLAGGFILAIVVWLLVAFWVREGRNSESGN